MRVIRSYLFSLALGLVLANAASARSAQDPGMRRASDEAGGLAERRAWAADLISEPTPTHFSKAILGLSDPDAELRGSLVQYLAKVELAAEQALLERLEALAGLAAQDGNEGLRTAALDALAQVGSPEAVLQLVALLQSTASNEREHIAGLLAGELFSDAQGRESILNLVQGSFRETGQALDEKVLRILLPAYGLLLAERTDAGATARERAPLLLARKHPSLDVRRAAEDALDKAIRRLGELERFEQSDRLLRRFGGDGLQPQFLIYLRSIEILEEGGLSPAAALALARELERNSGQVQSFVDSGWPARAVLVQANALLALGRNEEAKASLQRARELTGGLLARRFDLQGKQGALWQRELWNASAMVEFTDAFRLVAEGRPGDDMDVLTLLREAHVLQFRSQLVSIRSDLPRGGSMDFFFGGLPSPYRCVFATRPHEAWPARRALLVQGTLGRALATISPKEMPGFEPFAEISVTLSNPALDTRRAPLLESMSRERMNAVQRELSDLQVRRLKLLDQDPELEADLAMLSATLRRMRMDIMGKSLSERFYDLRQPSAHALIFADALGREDLSVESRKVAQRLFDDIEAEELRQQYTWAVQLAAQAKLAIGGAHSDLNQAAQAEKLMLEGLEYFEGLKTFYEERGLPGVASEVDDSIAEALVALAVNANVKGNQPVKAREYFERAYELRQDDFMRVLLACYRARSGDEAEARELMREVPDSPRGYYNLACTYALLGDTQESLDYLEKDFVSNRTSPAALEKQKAWARQDPDLSSLAQDPRFLRLTEPTPVAAEGQAADSKAGD